LIGKIEIEGLRFLTISPVTTSIEIKKRTKKGRNLREEFKRENRGDLL